MLRVSAVSVRDGRLKKMFDFTNHFGGLNADQVQTRDVQH